MKNKIFILSALIISAFVFSACTLKDETELKVLNKINNKVDQKIEEKTAKVNQETGDETEDELLNQLNSDKDNNLETEFKSIDTELSN